MKPATAILLSFLCACNGIEHSSEIVVRESVSFPLREGSTWVYALYDSVSELRDTLTARIVKVTETRDGSRSVWLLKYLHHTDTAFVDRSGDTLRFRHFEPDPFENNLTFEFPLDPGKVWSDQLGRTYSVISVDDVSWGRAGRGTRTHIMSHLGDIGDAGHIDVWFEPRVGIVRFQNFHFVVNSDIAPTMNQNWTLLTYTISS